MTEEQKREVLQRMYNSGMAVADCLRLLGRHEESHQVELWVIDNTTRVQNENK